MKNFIQAVKFHHDIEVVEARSKPVDVARNLIVDKFLDSDKDYLLFLDDDHIGHSMDMLRALLVIDAPICAIKCYTKVFPYFSNLLQYSGFNSSAVGLPDGQGKYNPIDLDFGYHYCDLVGFGMTLIKRDLFSKIEKPYFKADQDGIREDNYFCEKLLAVGIKPIGCFSYTLEHDGIGRENARTLREESMNRITGKLAELNPDCTNFSLIV